MKKFIMVTPLQPVTKAPDGTIISDLLKKDTYRAVGNQKLNFDGTTRFPLIQLINGYAEQGEEIRVITVTCDYDYCRIHLEQLREELAELQEKKGFLCPRGVESVEVPFAGDVATQVEIFHRLLPYFEDNDVLFGCMTYGMKPMPIAELMAIQYAYRVLKNVSIGCLVYGEVDYSADAIGTLPNGRKKYPMHIFDITALVQLDEIVRMLADRKVANPKKVIDQIISL
jgi:hypothetical protein